MNSNKSHFDMFAQANRWMARFSLLAIPLSTAMTTISIQPAKANDLVIYQLNTQAVCQQVGTESSPNAPVGTAPGWYLGLNTEIDEKILKGNIVAYKIKWSNGNWTGWYVPGVNDIDSKFNPSNNTMRRVWSYFTDHQHMYIICKQP